MRDQYRLTSTNRSQAISLQFDAAHVRIQNPTLSTILFRQGGSDIPTSDNADIIVPPQTTIHDAAIGRLFACTFDTAPTVGLSVALITLYDSSEFIGSIGSIIQPGKNSWYDRGYDDIYGEQVAYTGQNFASGGAIAPGGTTLLTIQPHQSIVTNDVQVRFEFVMIRLTRIAVATSGLGSALYVQVNDNYWSGFPNIAIIRMYANTVGAQETLWIPPFVINPRAPQSQNVQISITNGETPAGTLIYDWSVGYSLYVR